MRIIKWRTWIEDDAIIIQASCGIHHARRWIKIDRWNKYGRHKATFEMLIYGMQLDIEFLAGTEQ